MNRVMEKSDLELAFEDLARGATSDFEIIERLNNDPRFERCTRDGVPDLDGTHWKLR